MFKGDVVFCADAIFFDLMELLPDFDLCSMRDLCDRHCCLLLPDPALTSSAGALWDGEQILLSMRLDSGLLVEAISHELVHALSDGPRWEPLNSALSPINYDRLTFIEAVAVEVGHRFRQSSSMVN